MNEKDKERFSVLVHALSATCNRECDEALLMGYWIGLSDLEWSAFETACKRAIRECKFMPSPAELRQMAGEMTANQRSVLAWSAVERAAGEIGSYRSVDFEDPLINAVIRSMGGWPQLLLRGGHDFDKWARQEFIKAYEALDGVNVGSEECEPLPGLQTKKEPPRTVSVGYETENGLRVLSRDASVEKEETARIGKGEMASREVEVLLDDGR